MTTTRVKPNFSIPTEAWLKKQDIWRHNSFLGHVAMARANMQGIIKSKTATKDAKLIAYQILALTNDLKEALKERSE